MSKGDWRRPSAVSAKQVAANWERIFRAGDKATRKRLERARTASHRALNTKIREWANVKAAK